MANSNDMSLEDLRNSQQSSSGAKIDLTKGKVTTPAKGIATSDYIPDPEFAPTPILSKRTPVADRLEDINPTPVPMKVVGANFDPEDPNLTEFDPNTLPKKPAPTNELEDRLMGDLAIAVEKEKESITQRINAIVEKQYEEIVEGKVLEAEAIGVTPSTVADEDDLGLYYAADSAGPIAEPTTSTVSAEPPKTIKIKGDFIPDEEPAVQAPVEDADDIGNDYMEEELAFEREDEDVAPNLDDMEKDLAEEVGEPVAKLPSEEEQFEELKQAVKTNIVRFKNKIDLNKFTVADTPLAASKAVSFSIADMNRADWVLPASNRIISVSGLSGPEIFNLSQENSSRSRLNTYRDIYGIIYRHVVSEKPKTLDDWLKTIRFSDADHIYFALYKATFAGSNFLHYECPKCKHVFIKDYPFDALVKYKDDATKDKIRDLLTSSDSSVAPYDITRYQISDKYVVDIKEPSIYNTVIELSSLSDKFLTKYEDLLDTITFIDAIYAIDETNMKLVPIDTMPDKNNVVKSIARRINTFAQIIRTLPSDNYFDLRTQISTVVNQNDLIEYQVPEADCAKCGHHFNAIDIDAVNLLFTRQQLGAFGVI